MTTSTIPKRRSSVSRYIRNGLPPASIRGFGPVAARRVPLPPPRMTACMAAPLAPQEPVAFALHPHAPIVEQIADGLSEGDRRLPACMLGELGGVGDLQVGIDRPQSLWIDFYFNVLLTGRQRQQCVEDFADLQAVRAADVVIGARDR